MANTNETTVNKNSCFFCRHHIEVIDYKDVQLLRRFISSFAKIVSRKRSHTCAKHQRELSESIKRARIMALLPFVQE